MSTGARRMVFYWPVPPMCMFALMAATNPPPYLVGDGLVQRVVYSLAAGGMLATIVAPRTIRARNYGVVAATVACTWRVGILVLNGEGGGYDGIEVLAFVGVWVSIALMVIQMTVLTWPLVALGGKAPE